MNTDHIVRSYDEELHHLDAMILEMGGLAESQLTNALLALEKSDTELALFVRRRDAQLDELHQKVQSFSLRMLALRQPMAIDLRHVFCALQISAAAERIGDYASNAAKRCLVLSELPALSSLTGLLKLGNVVTREVHEVFNAYATADAERAVGVWERDVIADELYTTLFREIIEQMAEDKKAITTGIHLMFIAKNIERTGDHATNIAENIYLRVKGMPLINERPRADATSHV